MNKLIFLSERENYDFFEMKKSGITGVVFQDFLDSQRIRAAKSAGLSVYIIISATEKKPCKYLEKEGIREGYLYYVSKQNIKVLLELENIDGYIMQTPIFSGLLWDDSFNEEYENKFGTSLLDIFSEMFDEELEELPLREWYYEAVVNYSFRKMVLPIIRLAKKHNKDIICSFESQIERYSNLKKALYKDLYAKNGIKTIEDKSDYLELLETHDISNIDVLVIYPKRFILQSYLYGKKIGKTESRFLLSLFEEGCYTSSLKKCNYRYTSLSEKAVTSLKRSELTRFSNIIICESCIFEQKEINMIKYAQRKGVMVNSKELLDELEAVN